MLWPGTQGTWEKEEEKEEMVFFSHQRHLPGPGGRSAPLGRLQLRAWPGATCSSLKLACPGTVAAEQLLEKGKADARGALGVWEREGMSESRLEVACSLLLS